jgi:hypothetical protein
MRNLYLLPTDQPTGIFETNSGLQFSIMNKVRYGEFKGFHIYITSDEEIGEGDWYLDTTVNVIFKNDKLFLNGTGYKKIILSTDPELIADGVQSIDDEFLLWFVKNSSCEFVVIDWSPLSKNLYGWKIIIPQEEPKQESHICKYCNAETTQPDDECYAKPKQETLEEAAKKYAKGKSSSSVFQEAHKRDFITGANWQAERMYSEGEVYELLCQFFDDHVNAQNANISQWFEQNKKK